MMILIAVLLALVDSHQELISPDDFVESGMHMKELSISQLLAIFLNSEGIVDTLPDEAFSCPVIADENHGCQYSRIGNARVSGKSHGWCGQKSEDNEIIVDLTTSFIVSGVATQGRGDHDHWVTSYLIETSEDGHHWKKHGRFEGNFDRDTMCESRLDLPVLARLVRFSEMEYNAHPCMRLDVLVYHADKTTY